MKLTLANPGVSRERTIVDIPIGRAARGTSGNAATFLVRLATDSFLVQGNNTNLFHVRYNDLSKEERYELLPDGTELTLHV